MSTFLAFILPVATAFAGDRLNRLVLGKTYPTLFGMGARFALGLATGMLVFSQMILLAVLAGFSIAGPLAWTVLCWGLIECALQFRRWLSAPKQSKFQPGYAWLLLLLPVLYFWWIFGQLSVLEGTLEFDAAAFWVFKAKILYLVQGKEFLNTIHQSNLSYAHWDYPMLVPGIYTLGYGLEGRVYEFVNKVWPFWMVVALGLAILSLGNFRKQPHPLPVAVVVLLCFLPATLQYTRWEGGTIPMVFFTGLAALLVVRALTQDQPALLVAAVPVFVGCASTKFEGIIYTALWGGLLLLICWRRIWFKTPGLLKTVPIAAACLIPYALFRLAKPVAHMESGWWSSAVTSPGAMLQRFPDVWFMNLAARFFGPNFVHWEVGARGGLTWTGQWTGWDSLVNKELAVLPWLIVVLLILACFKARHRFVAATLSLAILGVFTVLAVVIASLPHMQADLAAAIDFAVNVVSRYSFPFMTAWFLGLAALWFPQSDPADEANAAEDDAKTAK